MNIRMFRIALFVALLSVAPLIGSASVRDDIRSLSWADRSRGVQEQRHTNTEILVKFSGDDSFTKVPNTRGESIDDMVARYRGRADVEFAEPNMLVEAYGTPNDPYFSYQWNLGMTPFGLHMPDAWNTSTGAGVIVAVVDTGVAYEDYSQTSIKKYYLAPDLAGTTFVPGYDFVNNDSHPNDDNGHGTHVTGTIAGTTNNGVGVAGVAYNASIMPVKVLDARGSGTTANVADGIRYAVDHGAQVINMSLGGSSPSSVIEAAVKYAYDHGVTVVAASGNNGASSISYPAGYNAYVIAVGATRYDGHRAPYSNYGVGLDLVAPGGDTTVDQNGDGYGDGIIQQTFSGRTNSWGYYFFDGTSMATPHVSGSAALVIANGVSGPDAVRNVLQSTALDLGASGYDTEFGYGLVQPVAALGGAVPPPPPSDAAPSVSITSPTNLDSVTGSITLAATASDDHGVTKVQFEVDGSSVGEDVSAPYSITWDSTTVANGAHTIKARAIDTVGQSTEHSVSVTVTNVAPPPATIIFSEGFESGLGAWTQDSQQDWMRSSQRSTQGSYSAEVDGSANNSSLQHTVPLSGATHVKVSFDWFIENGLDLGEYIAFDVSTNGGSTWVNLGSLNGNVDAENVWHAESYDLGTISSLILRFRGSMSMSSEDADVDNVVVESL